jgi:hypothetical protein
MKVKRRKFLQYAGLGSVGLVFADLERAIASALSEAAGSQDLKLFHLVLQHLMQMDKSINSKDIQPNFFQRFLRMKKSEALKN